MNHSLKSNFDCEIMIHKKFELINLGLNKNFMS